MAETKRVVDKLLDHKERYIQASKRYNIPWQLIAAIHNTEGSASFNHNIANGQRLGRRTTIVPKGHLWQTWDESVAFVYKQQGWDKYTIWNIPSLLLAFEKYNGMGYRRKNKYSQYLVGGSNIEQAGRYIADRVWSSTKWSKQIGCALILKELEKRGEAIFKGDCVDKYYSSIKTNYEASKPTAEDDSKKNMGSVAFLKSITDELGTKEIKGKRHNHRILEYWKLGKVALNVNTDEVAWCAAFTAFVLEKNNIRSSRKPNARSYLKWGVKIRTPFKGCIVVFKRGTSSWQGHVAFFSHIEGDYIYHWGGNQSDAVTLGRHHKTTLLGYRFKA